jgi:transcriptional regulator with XRE-family HTH domain
MTDRLFPALLRYWRGRQGHSQLDLALLADVSARHLSCLETGRARPSEAMVLRLMAALGAPLRDQNEALRAAGFADRFPEPGLDAISPAIDAAMARMLRQQEPFPLTLLSADYRVLRHNRAAARVFGCFVAEPAHLAAGLVSGIDMFTLLFDPALAQPFVEDWPALAGRMLARLHRETLHSGGDARLSGLLDRALRFPQVRDEWRQPDFSAPVHSTLNVWLRRGEMRAGFFTTLTAFSSPGNVTLDELRIESYFSLDDTTLRFCEQLAEQEAT